MGLVTLTWPTPQGRTDRAGITEPSPRMTLKGASPCCFVESLVARAVVRVSEGTLEDPALDCSAESGRVGIVLVGREVDGPLSLAFSGTRAIPLLRFD